MSRQATLEKHPKKRAVLEKDKLSKRDSIIQAAAYLLQKKEWAELSMDEVARRSKIAKGTLYLYFPTKEDLCLRVHNEDYGAWFNDLEEFLTLNESIELKSFSQWFVDSIEKHPRFIKLLPIVPTILEKNSSIETIRDFKSNLKTQIEKIIPILNERLHFNSFDRTFLFLMQCHAIAVGSWSHGFPSTNVRKAFEENGLSLFLIDYKNFVRSSIEALVIGNIERSKI
ncbi:MAG: TetR/AcrR family transcriptional regulator [Leptospira sp.]|nr:TetR/AcrR family transcriptional regulator [Leptospira sp.]